jgi:DNA-binding transcriptional LysR family regulator
LNKIEIISTIVSIMETDRIKQFCVLVETKSMTKAANLSGISLSGFSKSMTTLQAEVASQLFVQEGRGIAITPTGFSIYEDFKKILVLLEKIRDSDEGSEEVSLGFLEVFTYNLLGSILPANESNIYEIYEKAPGELEDQIFQGKIKYGYSYLPVGYNGVIHEPLAKIKLGAFVAKNSRLSGSVGNIPFVVPSSGLGFHPLSTKERDGWPIELGERTVFAKVNLLSTAIDLVRSGHCAIFMPEFVAEKLNKTSASNFNLIEMSIGISASKLKRDVYFVRREGTIENKFIKSLNARIKTELNQSLKN